MIIEKLKTKDVINNYLDIMNYILDYAAKNNLHTIEQIDDANLISDFMINVIGDFEEEILN